MSTRKKLTKKEVQAIIDLEGKLHEEYSNFFTRTYPSGLVEENLIYELPGDRFLFVLAPNEKFGGKGFVYAKDELLRSINWNKRLQKDNELGINGSVPHWRHYSKHKATLIDKIDDLILDLSIDLKIDPKILDKSYESLDILSDMTEKYNVDKAVENIYDNLVAYIGEVLRLRVKGNWQINEKFYGGDYPYIDIGNERIQLMPINIVWECLSGLNPVNFRKEVGNEVRRGKIKMM